MNSGAGPSEQATPDGSSLPASLASTTGSMEIPVTATLTSSPNTIRHLGFSLAEGRDWTASATQSGRSYHGSRTQAPHTSGQNHRGSGSS